MQTLLKEAQSQFQQALATADGSDDCQRLLQVYESAAGSIAKFRLQQFQSDFLAEKQSFDEQAQLLEEQIQVYQRIKSQLLKK